MSKVKLSAAELSRYSRHIAIPEFNMEGQQKLKAARVLVVGAGGLGSPMLLYLAAAGVGHLGIVDFDVIESSNLQRQVLFQVEDIGKLKAETAKERLLELNPHINIELYNIKLTKDNALDIIKDYDVVADGTDNFPTRYLINDACVLSGIPNVHGSIYQFEGQVSVFNYKDEKGVFGPNYRDLFPQPPSPELVTNCAEGGVLGVLPGIIGSMQANEIIKIITGVGETLSGRLFLFDAASFSTRILKIAKNPSTKIEGLINYKKFCGLDSTPEKSTKSISVQELKTWKDNQDDFQLIDVREPYEYEIGNLSGELISLGDITKHIDQISKDKKVVIYCRSGKRSKKAILALENLFPFDNLYNLVGGISAYSDEIDSVILKC